MTYSAIFDMGGVLMQWDPELLYRRLIPDLEERTWFLENVCTADWNLQQDRGRPFAQAISELIDQFPEHRTLIEAYWECWDEMLSGEMPGTDAVH